MNNAATLTTTRIATGNYRITYRGTTWDVYNSGEGYWGINVAGEEHSNAANTLADAKDFIRDQVDGDDS